MTTRRVTCALVVMLSCIAVIVVVIDRTTASGQTKSRNERSETLEAQKLIIRDNAGRERIVLGVDDEVPFMLLLDEKKKKRISLSVLPDGSAGVHIYEPESRKIRVELAALPDGVSQLNLIDRTDKHRVTCAVNSKGVAEFTFRDAKDRTLMGLFSGADQARKLLLSDGNAIIRALVMTAPEGEPSVRLYDKEGSAKVLTVP